MKLAVEPILHRLVHKRSILRWQREVIEQALIEAYAQGRDIALDAVRARISVIGGIREQAE